MNKKLYVISGSSGVGKGTVIKELLRIHPDGNRIGTEGCIGLTGDYSVQKSFVNLFQPLYEAYGNILLNVNIKGNPNYHHF